MNLDLKRAGEQPARVLWSVAPEEDESLLSVVKRTAHENLLPHTLCLMRAAGTTYGHRTALVERSDEQVAALAQAIGLDPAEALRRAPRLRRDGRVDYAGAAYDLGALERRALRFAPGSLRLSPHHRAIWDCRILTYCPTTWEYLLDRCHACGARQAWYHASPIDRCDACDADLCDAKTHRVDETLRDSLRIVNGLLSSDDCQRSASIATLPYTFHGLPPELILDLVIAMMRAVDVYPEQALFRQMWRSDPERHVANLAAAADAVRVWPNIAPAFDNTAESLGDIRLAHKRWTKVLSSDRWAGDRLEPIVAQALAALPSPKRPARAKRRRIFEVLDTVINSRTLVEMTGLTTSQIASQRQLGHLTGRKVKHGKGVHIAYDEAEAEELQAFLKGGIGWETVARELGIPRHAVEQLACLRVLPASDHPVVLSLRGPLRFRRTSLDMLLEAFVSRAMPLCAVADPLCLGQAIRVCCGGLKPWGSVFRALLDGDIEFGLISAVGPLSSRLLIGRRSLPQLRQMAFDRAAYPAFAFESHAGVRDAVSELGLGSQTMSTLRAFGAHEPRGANKASVPVCAIEQIAAEYVTSGELALRTGSTTWHIREILNKAIGSPLPVGWPRTKAEQALGERLSMS